MKSTEAFRETIKAHLDQMANQDAAFAEKYIFAQKPKTLDNCINYILNTVKQSGCNGFTDDEIFRMAVHFYQEDELGAVKPCDMNVVVNHHIELTEKEKDAARKKAIEDFQASEFRKLQEQQKRTKEREEKKAEKKQSMIDKQNEGQLALFDYEAEE